MIKPDIAIVGAGPDDYILSNDVFNVLDLFAQEAIVVQVEDPEAFPAGTEEEFAFGYAEAVAAGHRHSLQQLRVAGVAYVDDFQLIADGATVSAAPKG